MNKLYAILDKTTNELVYTEPFRDFELNLDVENYLSAEYNDFASIPVHDSLLKIKLLCEELSMMFQGVIFEVVELKWSVI